MALIDEQLVEEWLNRNQFFTMRGVKCGVDEIDLLAAKHINGASEHWHVEVQVSYRPIGYIGGDSNARRRSQKEIENGVKQWVERKFTSERKIKKRNEISPNADWRYVLVHGELKDSSELDYMKEMGIEVIPYKAVLKELCESKKPFSSSIASNITDMLNYLKM